MIRTMPPRSFVTALITSTYDLCCRPFSLVGFIAIFDLFQTENGRKKTFHILFSKFPFCSGPKLLIWDQTTFQFPSYLLSCWKSIFVLFQENELSSRHLSPVERTEWGVSLGRRTEAERDKRLGGDWFLFVVFLLLSFPFGRLLYFPVAHHLVVMTLASMAVMAVLSRLFGLQSLHARPRDQCHFFLLQHSSTTYFYLVPARDWVGRRRTHEQTDWTDWMLYTRC